MGGNSAASAVQGCAAEESGEENGRPRTGGGKGPIEKMGTQNRQKKMRNGRAERRTPLRMGKIKLQTEHRREKTEERFTQFVSLGHLSTAGMPIGTVGVAAAQAGHARAEDERDHADVMTDAATVLSDYEGSPEESELFERARRLGEANLLDVWGGRPSTRSNAPLPSTTASLLPQKTPSRLQPRASATSERRVDDSALVHPGSRSLLPHASAPRRSIQPTGSGTLSTSHRLGASPRLWRVTSAPTSHQSGRDQGQLSSSSGYGSGRGTCNALDNEGILPLRSASSSATAKGKSAAENERCGGCSCEEGSALRREVDFLKHIIATRSIRSDASPLADASIADGDTSSSSRMSPLLQDAPPNASQQALHSSPPLVPRPPPSGNRFHSPECSGPGRCNGRTSTCSSAREHPASARTAPVASIFLGQGHEGEAAARRSIARPRRVSNPASADNLVDEDVFFSKAGSLDGGIASAPRNCAPKQTGMNFNADFARPPVQPSPPSASDPFAMRKLQLLPAPPSPSTDEYRGPALSMRGALRTEADSVSQPMQAYADYRQNLAQMQAEIGRLEAKMAEMKSQHAVEVKRLEEEGMRRGAKASLASERREIELRGKIIDAAQKARKHIFQHQMAESKISSGALPSLTLAGHEKSLAEEVQEAQEALQSEREVAQMASLTLWMMATGRKAASFISATGEAASAPHALLVTLQHDPDFRDLVFESCGQELCAHLTLACVD